MPAIVDEAAGERQHPASPKRRLRRASNLYVKYGRLLNGLAAKASAGVKNTGTAFGLLLDLAERTCARNVDNRVQNR
jgi:hypothetical protein